MKRLAARMLLTEGLVKKSSHSHILEVSILKGGFLAAELTRILIMGLQR
jgi:hypothetical protein